jgi:hypothetical protein
MAQLTQRGSRLTTIDGQADEFLGYIDALKQRHREVAEALENGIFKR